MRAAREYQRLALLCGVGLDDANASEGLTQPPGKLGVDLSALAKYRPQPRKSDGHASSENHQGEQCD
jgi:hypothetical protein